ncbi:MAG: excinuclease ABC subunit UvrC [Bacteroidetes bacterium]|nr:excinuclease ABC subunit UvrC [Bacteroidota bacterium]
MSNKKLFSSSLLNIVYTLPDNPGVYQYFDKHGKIIYIGKAKNLKKRVSSYFTKKHEYGKLLYLVTSIADIKYIVVETELDALLLENNLIKKYQPRYNVALKDDKTYPWICIKNESFPRVFQTRNFIRDGSQYFGPYTSLRTMYTILDLIKKLYPLRNCALNLSKENIEKKKFRVCLEYHLKNCKGPCEAFQSEENYNDSISQIKQILKGNIFSVIKQLKELMWQYSEKYDFENAQLLKQKIDSLEKYQSRSVVVSPTIEDADVFSIISDEAFGYVNYLKVINGAIVQAHTVEMKKKLDETNEELLLLAIAELRQRFFSETKEIIVPFAPDVKFPDVEFTIPQRGDKKKLMELSERNAEYYKKEKENRQAFTATEKSSDRILKTMMNDLRLKELPIHIECFDNSNIQGAHPVSACVVFRNAKPTKNDYRIFNIKTVEGPDDFASMEEVIMRRYKRMLDEKQSLPQLIVIDGGKGQVSSALKSLEMLGLAGKIPVIGIAKKLEEVYYPGDSMPLYLNKKSETLKVIQQMRDEAHRFGLKHHRGRRSRETIFSELTQIKGISDKTAEKLLQEFKSVSIIKETPEEKIAEVIGKAKAKKLLEHFKKPHHA